MNSAFYELKHEISADYFTVERNSNFSFPLHMHRCYEIILLIEGSMTIILENQEYIIEAGDMILIKPNFVHGLKTDMTSRHILCIFSPELISAISEPLEQYLLTSPVIRNVPELYRTLFENAREDAAIGGIKGFLYLLSNLFYEQLDMATKDPDANGKHLLRDIFRYVEQNMQGSCSMQELGCALGYSPSYLSRFFYTSVGMPYTGYIRNIKISHACYLLRNTQNSVSDIARQCGYVSSTSFNRNFKQMTDCSPTEYRSRKFKSKKI